MGVPMSTITETPDCEQDMQPVGHAHRVKSPAEELLERHAEFVSRLYSFDND